MRDRILKWMNAHSRVTFWLLTLWGWSLHLLYEYVHWPKPIEAAIVLTGAGIAGLAVDLRYTKREEGVGEID